MHYLATNVKSVIFVLKTISVVHIVSWSQDSEIFWLCTYLKIWNKQAGAEVCQAQVKLEVIVDVWVEVGVEDKGYH